MPHQIEPEVLAATPIQHPLQGKSLEQIKHIKGHYERTYYNAKVRGKRVLRWLLSKLNRIISYLQVEEKPVI